MAMEPQPPIVTYLMGLDSKILFCINYSDQICKQILCSPLCFSFMKKYALDYVMQAMQSITFIYIP